MGLHHVHGAPGLGLIQEGGLQQLGRCREVELGQDDLTVSGKDQLIAYYHCYTALLELTVAVLIRAMD